MKLIALAALTLAPAISAQAPKSVPVTSEPHHHLVFTTPTLRVFRVEVPKGTSTLLHEHAVDYFWIGIGSAQFENEIPGKPVAKVVSTDGAVHFTRGKFAHVANIDGPSTFYNVTLEVPLEQTNPRNLCAVVIAGEKMNCPEASKRAIAVYTSVKSLPEFETDQTRVTLLTVEPDQALEIKHPVNSPVLVAVDAAEGTLHTTCNDPAGAKTDQIQPKSGDSFVVKATTACILHNASPKAVRFLVVDFLPAR